MFRKKTPQRSLNQTDLLLPPEKMARLKKTWAWVFREHALGLIREEAFREIYCPDNDRPNIPVKTVVGLLVIKEMFGLTGEEVLNRLEYDLSVQIALGLTPEEAHTCQKTLHNFRVNLLAHGLAKVLFQDTVSEIIQVLGWQEAHRGMRAGPVEAP